jgi:hypothetical protein
MGVAPFFEKCAIKNCVAFISFLKVWSNYINFMSCMPSRKTQLEYVFVFEVSFP